MPRKRQINADPDPPGLRSTLDTASEPVRAVAHVVEERVVWRGADLLRAVVEVVKWPFERLAWLFERRLLWPLQKHAAERGVNGRIVGGGAVAVATVGLIAFAAVSLSGSDGGPEPVAVSAPATAVVEPASAPTAEEPSEPVLQGAPPSFEVGEGVGVAEPGGEPMSDEGAAVTADTPVASATSGEGAATSSKQPVSAGPVAMKVARRFTEAFVFYEIGEKPERTQTVFEETTTPRLASALEERPPRQPEGIEVPQARVLNLVPGPRSGKTYTVSASLLRVGTTSELRLEMKRENGLWRVTDVRG